MIDEFDLLEIAERNWEVVREKEKCFSVFVQKVLCQFRKWRDKCEL